MGRWESLLGVSSNADFLEEGLSENPLSCLGREDEFFLAEDTVNQVLCQFRAPTLQPAFQPNRALGSPSDDPLQTWPQLTVLYVQESLLQQGIRERKVTEVNLGIQSVFQGSCLHGIQRRTFR